MVTWGLGFPICKMGQLIGQSRPKCPSADERGKHTVVRQEKGMLTGPKKEFENSRETPHVKMLPTKPDHLHLNPKVHMKGKK